MKIIPLRSLIEDSVTENNKEEEEIVMKKTLISLLLALCLCMTTVVFAESSRSIAKINYSQYPDILSGTFHIAKSNGPSNLAGRYAGFSQTDWDNGKFFRC